ncbi:putative serine protease K12H4.7 [Ylistrum balloti]|uniref:putative serine protease K12H4.7 n=1 Tax=Ylistrum balloti TaxID=509963 RepID=UPI0029058204|nr:putative serine protease K12H4.7 [Ylistrum balloti]
MADVSKAAVLLIVCSFCTIHAYIPKFHRGRPKGGMLGRPNVKSNHALPPDMWVTQRLDHFNDADTSTWQQRYFVNDTFYKKGGPVFVMIGGEGTADPIWMVEGAWIDYAQKFNAFCLQLEHRYYGKSHPTKDMGTGNLIFLSSEQALADLAYFITYAKQKFGLEESKLITFGGSYPGSLSAWFRLKYPHLVDGAVASSAPIKAVLNFYEYLGVVTNSLATTGQSCNKNVAAATDDLASKLQTAAGHTALKTMFNMCDDLDPSDPDYKLDVANLVSSLVGNFEGVVQYNKDNRAFEGAVATNITVDTLCEVMNDASVGDPLNRYAKVNEMILTAYSEKCLDYKYRAMIEDLQKTSWNSSAGEGGRQWTYQTCTEFAFFQSSDLSNKTQPFGSFFPLNFSIQQCIDIFGAKFNRDLIQSGVNRTNTNYGGESLKVTKVAFPNGSIDPWHALGIVDDSVAGSTAIYIDGTAHCANMYPSTDSDPAELTKARQVITGLISAWISK